MIQPSGSQETRSLAQATHLSNALTSFSELSGLEFESMRGQVLPLRRGRTAVGKLHNDAAGALRIIRAVVSPGIRQISLFPAACDGVELGAREDHQDFPVRLELDVRLLLLLHGAIRRCTAWAIGARQSLCRVRHLAGVECHQRAVVR